MVSALNGSGRGDWAQAARAGATWGPQLREEKSTSKQISLHYVESARINRMAERAGIPFDKHLIGRSEPVGLTAA